MWLSIYLIKSLCVISKSHNTFFRIFIMHEKWNKNLHRNTKSIIFLLLSIRSSNKYRWLNFFFYFKVIIKISSCPNQFLLALMTILLHKLIKFLSIFSRNNRISFEFLFLKLPYFFIIDMFDCIVIYAFFFSNDDKFERSANIIISLKRGIVWN